MGVNKESRRMAPCNHGQPDQASQAGIRNPFSELDWQSHAIICFDYIHNGSLVPSALLPPPPPPPVSMSPIWPTLVSQLDSSNSFTPFFHSFHHHRHSKHTQTIIKVSPFYSIRFSFVFCSFPANLNLN